MTKSIALIFHENERIQNVPRFAIWHLAEIWRRENFKVFFLFGVKKHIPADVAILHVDLTVVPDIYMDFANRYPFVLNGEIKDISKSSFSGQKISPDEGYKGPVIVKSDLNYAGQPEKRLLGNYLSRLALRISCRWLPSHRFGSRGAAPNFRSPYDYLILDSLLSVPREWLSHEHILVEKFIPEMQDGLYCQRVYHFLGERGVCVLRRSRCPIVNASNVVNREVVAVHPEVVKIAKSMKFDYGKFDYVMHEGKPALLDANKTPGSGETPLFFSMCREWATGIRSYI